MKRLLVISAALVLLFLPVYLYPVYAVTTRTATSGAMNALKSRVQNNSALQAKLESLDERIASAGAKLASRTAELKKKLGIFKDQKKAQLALKISDNLNKINQQKSKMYGQHLDKLEQILSKVSKKVDEASGSGNLDNARAVIASASASILTARQALLVQVSKDYTVTATAEASLKSDVKKQRELLHTDLDAIHDLIVVAHKAVSEAINTTRKGLGGSKSGE